MGAVDGAKLTRRLLADNPRLLLLAGVVGLAATAVHLLSAVPFVGALAGLGYLFVEPYLAGGVLGAVDEAVDGEPVPGAFTERAGEHYGDLLVARAVLFVPLLGYEVVVGTAVGGLTAAVAGTAGRLLGVDGAATEVTPGTGWLSQALAVVGPPDATAALAAALAVGALAAAVVAFAALQFYPAAIVVAGAGPVESFRYSYRFAREYPRQVAGYTAVTSLGGLALLVPAVLRAAVRVAVVGTPFVASDGAAAFLAGHLAASAAFLLALLAVKTAVVALVRTYHVAFVRTTLDTA